jgi:RNA polymerase sigma-70 factor (ECF subfamily)
MTPSTAREPLALDPRDEALHLFEADGTALYRFCRFTLGRADEAEDVVQETFVKLLVHLESGAEHSNLRGWLFTVAANACRDRMRWRMRWVPWRQELDTRTVAAVDGSIVHQARQAMRLLSPRDRMLLSLRAQGMSYREIATAAGIAPVSVGRLLARAVSRWKRKVDSAGQ